jgi:glucose-1-phosphate thymidylyltransferase
MKALILSGGTGTRLRPVTYSTAKQLIPLANKPVLFYLIEKAVSAGIRDIGIVVGDNHKQIKAEVGNGEKWDADITYIYQEMPLGLAHAVKTASEFIKGEDFLMLLGDNVFQENLDEFLNHFYSVRSNASLLLHRVKNPASFGVALVENGRIVRLVEKPERNISSMIITGVYIFDKSIFEAVNAIKPSGRGELEITDAIQGLIDHGGSISFKTTKGWWKDTGKLSDVLEANRLLMDDILREDKFPVGKNVTVKNSVINGPAIFGDSSVIINCVIGPYTCIGQNAVLENCRISNSIVMEGAVIKNMKESLAASFIGKNTVIEGINNSKRHSTFFVGDSCQIRI